MLHLQHRKLLRLLCRLVSRAKDMIFGLIVLSHYYLDAVERRCLNVRLRYMINRCVSSSDEIPSIGLPDMTQDEMFSAVVSIRTFIIPDLLISILNKRFDGVIIMMSILVLLPRSQYVTCRRGVSSDCYKITRLSSSRKTMCDIARPYYIVTLMSKDVSMY